MGGGSDWKKTSSVVRAVPFCVEIERERDREGEVVSVKGAGFGERIGSVNSFNDHNFEKTGME